MELLIFSREALLNKSNHVMREITKRKGHTTMDHRLSLVPELWTESKVPSLARLVRRTGQPATESSGAKASSPADRLLD